MAKVRLSEKAADDLEAIFVYTIETFGLTQAERYKTALDAGFQRLGNDPRLGKPIIGRTRTFYHYTCERHAIFYAKEDGGIFIVRVLHVAMDFLRHLPE